MQLLELDFNELGVKIPHLADIENETNFLNLKCICKFRHHQTGWEWYVIAGKQMTDGNWDLYCYVKGLDNELGFVYLDELLRNGAMFCPTFIPCRVGDLVD